MTMRKTLLFLNMLFVVVFTQRTREVILSSGLISWDHKQLLTQYNAYNVYANAGIITASSILVYEIDIHGNLNQYNTTDPLISAEQFQMSLQKLGNDGLSSYPCIYCDATIGYCKNLTDRMEHLYEHKYHFINDTIQRAIKYNWNGYTIDLEPDQKIDALKLSHFIVEWSNELTKYNLLLYVWIGTTTVFDINILSESNANIRLITMDTYVDDYDSFLDAASNTLLLSSKPQNIGFGLLTNIYNTSLSETALISVSSWANISMTCSLSIWASIIPPQWFKGLKNYLSE